MIRYPGGWGDASSELITDSRLVPLNAKIMTGEGDVEFRLIDYHVSDEETLPLTR